MGQIRILTDRRTEYSGKPETHDYQLYLALNELNIVGPRPITRKPMASRSLHKTILQDFYQVAFRRKIYRSIEELRIDLDNWLICIIMPAPISESLRVFYTYLRALQFG